MNVQRKTRGLEIIAKERVIFASLMPFQRKVRNAALLLNFATF